MQIRPYRAADHNACRRLWGELVEHQGALYATTSHSTAPHSTAPLSTTPGDRADPGDEDDASAGFEEYLTRLDLSGLWVADAPPDGVVGFVGLTLNGSGGCVDPIVVTHDRRGQGIGRALLETVAAEARHRELTELTISPPARDQAALRSLYAAGFGSVASLTLTYPLRHPDDHPRGRSDEPEPALHLYDLRFRS